MRPHSRFSWHSFGLFLACLLALTVLFVIFKRPVYRLFGDFFSPYVSVGASAMTDMRTAAYGMKSRMNLVSENLKLRDELERLQIRHSEYETLKKENAYLRRIQRLPPLPDYRYLQAQIVLRSPLDWGETFMINRGAADGVVPGAVVLAPGHLTAEQRDFELVIVGRVGTEISLHTARVETLLSPRCAVSAFLEQSKLPTVVRGGRIESGSTFFSADFIPVDRPLFANESVRSSGFSPQTPKGLLIGRITPYTDGALKRPSDELYGTAQLLSPVDLMTLDWVVIPLEKH